MVALPHPTSLLVFQNTMTVFLNLVAAWTLPAAFPMKRWRMEHLAQFAVQAVFMSLSLSLNLLGLPRNAVATLLVFKSLQVIQTAVLEYLLNIARFSTKAYLYLAV